MTDLYLEKLGVEDEARRTLKALTELFPIAKGKEMIEEMVTNMIEITKGTVENHMRELGEIVRDSFPNYLKDCKVTVDSNIDWEFAKTELLTKMLEEFGETSKP